mgnify:FL=1|jgi:TP901-1 family phage major tail protein
MASTGKVNGTLLGLYVGGVKIAEATSHTLNLSMGTRDTTTKDSAGWKNLLEALREWSIDCDFVFAPDSAYGFTDLFALYTGRTVVTIKAMYTAVSGDKYYQGSAMLTSLNQSAPMEDNVTCSVTFEGSAALTEKTLT